MFANTGENRGFIVCLSFSMAKYPPSLYHLVHNFLGGLLDLPDAFSGRLLDVTHGLIRLTLGPQLVIAGQHTSRFLDSTLHYVCLATHDDDSFSFGNPCGQVISRPQGLVF
jgi:hypothetical protein